MPAAASPEPKIASPMPASPQNSSSAATGSISPLGSAKDWAMKSNPYRPICAASLTTGQGNSSRSSHSWATGRMTSSAKSWTHFWTCWTSSESSSEKSAMLVSYHSVTSARHPRTENEERQADHRRPHQVGRRHADVLEEQATEGGPH